MDPKQHGYFFTKIMATVPRFKGSVACFTYLSCIITTFKSSVRQTYELKNPNCNKCVKPLKPFENLHFLLGAQDDSDHVFCSA